MLDPVGIERRAQRRDPDEVAHLVQQVGAPPALNLTQRQRWVAPAPEGYAARGRVRVRVRHAGAPANTPLRGANCTPNAFSSGS